MNKLQLFINGDWLAPRESKYRDIIDPATEDVIAQAADGGRADALIAISSAREAFDAGPWPQASARDRAKILNRIADAIDSDTENLARLETLNTGKTIIESRTDMGDIAATFRYFAGLLSTEAGSVNEAPPHVISMSLREPVGVCGLITPWNYPLLQAAWKIAPALAAGNTVIVKPSSLTPLTTHRFTELLQAVGLPNGVFNLVTGSADVGQTLATSHDVDLISFTGGASAGASVMQAATGNFKKVSLELGGKNPNIIFADADFDAAVDYALNAGFFHAGQVCSAGSRLMIEAPLYDRFIAALTDRIRHIRLGNGFLPETQMGPVISAAQRTNVLAMVEMGCAEGARLICGGVRPAGSAYEKGFWIEPALLADVNATMRVAREEIFGPVITVEKFSSEAEALSLANGTPYGLAGAVWTQDLNKANRMMRRMRFGTVWVNDYHPYFPEAPWGGYKASGIGRELSKTGLEEYTELKHAYINLAPTAMNWF